MTDKVQIKCASCGKPLLVPKEASDRKLLCKKCRAARSQDQTQTMIDPGESSQTQNTDVTADMETIVDSEAGTQTVFDDRKMSSFEGENITDANIRLEKNVAAIKLIRNFLNIDPSIDLEHSSRSYYASKTTLEDSQTGPSVRDIITKAQQDTKYIVDDMIGRGGMGAVMGTVDQDIRRKVAMKIMLPQDRTNTSKVKRFLEEAQITGQLEHPNIVPVHEIGIDEESKIYFTMKLVQGEDLELILEKCEAGDQAYVERYSLGNLIQLFMKVCDGISYSHAKGVLHRDLKPENIMVGDFGEVLVMDWGIAKILGQDSKGVDMEDEALEEALQQHDQTMEGRVMGTPSYMSPEQAWGKVSELDERSDVFSLGGILYKILTGLAPYEGDSALDKLEDARNYELVPPDMAVPERNIPPELNAICMKAMAYHQEERYTDARELKSDLQLYLDGKSVSAKRDSLLVRTRKWIVRNKVAAIGIAAALICLIAGGVFMGLYEQRKRFEKIAVLLDQGEQASQAGRFEAAEETFFAVLGLDSENRKAREGIGRVSGKALAIKNKRLAQDQLKTAQQLFKNKAYIKAYDAYVATFALDPDSQAAREGIKTAAVLAEKQKARAKIAPILDETKVLVERNQALNKTIATLSTKLKTLKANIKGYEGLKVKKGYWEIEKEILAAKIENLKIEGEVISKYLTVLSHDGTDIEARRALSQIYYDKYVAAEVLQNQEEMAYYKALVLTFDDGHYKHLLTQEGSLTLTTAPAASAYYLYRFIEGPDRRMIPAPFHPDAFRATFKENKSEIDLRGVDPAFNLRQAAYAPLNRLLKLTVFNRFDRIDRLTLPEGSYLVVCQKKGYLNTRVPVQVQRGETKVLPAAKLLRQTSVPKGFVYIPGGEFVMGGDPQAPYAVERTVKTTPAFLIAKHEVSAGEYLQFINYLESRMPGSAEKYLPRKSVSSGFYWKKNGGRYESTFPENWPVLGVSWNDARAFCKWMTRQNQKKGWTFRLPEDWEWEKASRGVDGRYFPWGNYFDFSFCSMANSKQGKRDGPDKKGNFSIDESVYGAMDMAGNVSEWCQTYYDQAKNIRINRGAAWSYVADDYARCSARNGHSPTDVADFRGFRLAMTLSN